MIKTTFTDFRKSAKRFFDAVEEGNTVQVSKHGRPVADLVPSKVLQERPLWKRRFEPLVIPGLSLSAEILKDRAKCL